MLFNAKWVGKTVQTLVDQFPQVALVLADPVPRGNLQLDPGELSKL
jgi:hypothetical protein